MFERPAPEAYDRFGQKTRRMGVLYAVGWGDLRLKVERGETELERAYREGWQAAATALVNRFLERRASVQAAAVKAYESRGNHHEMVYFGPQGSSGPRVKRHPEHPCTIHLNDALEIAEAVLSSTIPPSAR